MKRSRRSSHHSASKKNVAEHMLLELTRMLKKSACTVRHEDVDQMEFLKIKPEGRALADTNGGVISSRIDFDVCEPVSQLQHEEQEVVKPPTDFSRFKPVKCEKLLNNSLEPFSYSPGIKKVEMTPLTKTLGELAWLTKRTMNSDICTALDDLFGSISCSYQQ